MASAFFSPRAVSYSLCHFFFHGAHGEQLSTASSRTADHWDLSPKSNLFGAKPTCINLACCSLPMLPFPHACMKWTCCHKVNSTAPQQQPACLFLHCCKHHVTHSSREQLAWRGDAESALSFSSQCMTGADLHEVVGCGGRRAACTTTSGSPPMARGLKCTKSSPSTSTGAGPCCYYPCWDEHGPTSCSVDRHCEEQLLSSSHMPPISHFLPSKC